MYHIYLHTIETLLEGIVNSQEAALEAAARMVGDTLKDDGLVYLFGCGHSHIMAEEGFYRAGGLGAVYPMLQSDIMLHEGAVKSSSLERKADLAQEIILRYPMTSKDTMIVFSNSGINGLPVEMARGAELAIDEGSNPAIYVSGNVPGGREINESVIARYRHRVRSM